MGYKLKTQEVKEGIALKITYPLVSLEWNVDGTACLLVKVADGKYYENKIPREEMQMESDALASLIVARVDSYFNGWAVRKGIRTV